PTVTDYLGIEEGMNLRRGKVDEAYAMAKRVLEIRQRVYPPTHVKIAEALHELANVEAARNNAKAAVDDNTKALAIAEQAKPEPLVLMNAIHVSLGFAAAVAGDHAAAVKHFEQAVALTRKSVGSDSLELAVLLLNFGQIKAEDNLEAGLGLLGEAKTILDRLHDKRAGAAGAVSAVILARHKRWPEARKLLEEAIANADVDTEPENLGQMKWILAQALVETHGERARAKKLAKEARDLLAAAGAVHAETVKLIDGWLAKH
ncbi:MAG TPA: tetratricopeptide repeat protein, partial [Kofleriaceae bacterium]|nr:tetratricopeptide repeat protein [Kofleriaceae bacterium]